MSAAYQRLSAAYKNQFVYRSPPPLSDPNAVNQMQFELGMVDIGNTSHPFAGAVATGQANSTSGKRTVEDH